MAKLSQLKQNKIRCLLICDKHGDITKVSDQNKFDDTLSTYEADEVVKVFNPTEAQKTSILKLLENNTKDEEVSLEGNIVLEIINTLTDIEIDLEGEEVEAILNEPNDLLIAVNSEINSILFNLVSLQFKNIKDMSKLPPELLQATVEGLSKTQEEVEKKPVKKGKKVVKG